MKKVPIFLNPVLYYVLIPPTVMGAFYQFGFKPHMEATTAARQEADRIKAEAEAKRLREQAELEQAIKERAEREKQRLAEIERERVENERKNIEEQKRARRVELARLRTQIADSQRKIENLRMKIAEQATDIELLERNSWNIGVEVENLRAKKSASDLEATRLQEMMLNQVVAEWTRQQTPRPAAATPARPAR